MHTVILGAGLAGLSTAYHLGGDYTLLEQASEPGGLARSRTRDGFTFDVTGHWLHLSDPEVQRLVQSLLGDDLVTVARRAQVYTHGRYLPYPFQTNLRPLPDAVRAECLEGFLAARFASSRGWPVMLPDTSKARYTVNCSARANSAGERANRSGRSGGRGSTVSARSVPVLRSTAEVLTTPFRS